METEVQLSKKDERRSAPCLCVDLDGTLVQTDTLLESLVVLLRANPKSFFHLFLCIFMGKARFKQELARVVTLQPEALPYTVALLDYIQSEANRGRRVILATGADSSVANVVAEHLGLFSHVI